MFYGIFSRPAVHFDTEKDIPDLAGKVIAITGGNAGLGLETVLRLAPHNPSHIYILSRNPSTTSTSIAQIQAQVPHCCPLTHVPLDLSDLSSVSSCADVLKNYTSRLDILFLNAGIMMVPPGLTKQGYEVQFGTNHLGHFLLSELLVDLLGKTAGDNGGDVRVVVVSSIGMRFSPLTGIPYPSLKSTGSSFTLSSLYRYGVSKLANALFAKGFNARYHSRGITCVSVHPGVIATGLWSETFSFAQNWGRVGEWMKYLGRCIPLVGFESVETGVRNQLWAAVGRKGGNRGEVKGGEFYTPVGVAGQGTWASADEGKARELWEWSEREVGGFLKG